MGKKINEEGQNEANEEEEDWYTCPQFRENKWWKSMTSSDKEAIYKYTAAN